MNIETKKAINFIKNKPTIRMIQKKDSEENWDRSTMKPLDGEIIIYSKDEKHNYPRIKIGDGETPVAELEFIDDHLKKDIESVHEYAKIIDYAYSDAVQKLNEKIDSIHKEINDIHNDFYDDDISDIDYENDVSNRSILAILYEIRNVIENNESSYKFFTIITWIGFILGTIFGYFIAIH